MDDARRSPAIYNAPLIRSGVNLPITTAAGRDVLTPDENLRGMFLSRFSMWGYRDVAQPPGVVLYVARRAVPGAFLDGSDVFQFVGFARSSHGAYVTPDVTHWTVNLDYEPRAPLFIPPSHGVYLATYSAITGAWWSASFFFDIEQRGR